VASVGKTREAHRIFVRHLIGKRLLEVRGG